MHRVVKVLVLEARPLLPRPRDACGLPRVLQTRLPPIVQVGNDFRGAIRALRMQFVAESTEDLVHRVLEFNLLCIRTSVYETVGRLTFSNWVCGLHQW